VADLSAYDPIFEDAGRAWNVDPLLLKSIAGQESGGRKSAVSPAGAEGLMQIMPGTQRALGMTDPNDPVQSIFGGAKYLAEGLDREGSPAAALLFYHGGPEWRRAYGPESKAYVPAVAARYAKLATAGTPPPPPATPAATDSGPEVKAQATAEESPADFLKRTTGKSEPADTPGETPADFLMRTAPKGAETTKAEPPPPPEMPPGDTQMTTAQVAEEQRRQATANKSGYFALEPKEPGFNHLLWSLGAPFAAIGQTALGERPLPTGVNALQMAAPLAGAGDLRFSKPAIPPSGPPPDAYVAANAAAAKEAPLSSGFRADPLTPEAKATIAESGPPPPGTSSPTGIPVPPRVPPEVPPTPVTASPGTSLHAKQIAGAYYDIADKSGGTLTPRFTNAFVDSVAAAGKQTEAGQVTAGQNAVSSLADRLQALKDKPMTLKAAQEVDEALGDLIDKEYGVKGLSKDGRKLAEIQSNFRDQISNAREGDVTGGKSGFEALDPARKAWSQAMKMDELERIQQRANMTDNPATSFKTQIRTLINSRTKSRGYSDEELAALKDAANRGFLGGALHVFGSRLIPLVAGGVGFGTGGVVSGAVNAAAAHGVSTLFREGATAIANRRLGNALKTLGRSVPPNPNPLIPPP
jgi:hypothetical protein